VLMLAIVAAEELAAQTSRPAAKPDEITINLADAIMRAGKYGSQVQLANILTQLAHEDRAQARAATLPSLSALSQFIYTEGNGTPSGVFVANDGVHVYNEQAVVHEDLLALLRRSAIHAATASEIVAKAKADIATRGLTATVVANYYAVASALRKLANAQKALGEAQAFLDITRKQESGGEAAHSDVIKAQIQLEQRRRDVEDGALMIQKAKIALAILIFPALNLNYRIVDDLGTPDSLPALAPGGLPVFNEFRAQATGHSAELHAAEAGLQQSKAEVSVARSAYLPSFTLDFFYGIDANQFAARTNYPTPESGRSTLPNYLVPYRQNLGYSGIATLIFPVWSWGSIRSKVKQAELRQQQAELDLSSTQKQVAANIESAYQEAQTALYQIESLRSSSELAAESLKLTVLRYQAGEATTLEVVDAQATANAARIAYDDGLVRYRLALADLRILTGQTVGGTP
jgi:outer membrane protein TolC